jgi:hypothetical protein
MHNMKLILITLLLAVAFCSCSEAARPSKSLKVNRTFPRRLSRRKEHVLERAVRVRGGSTGVQAVGTLEKVQSILHDAGEHVSLLDTCLVLLTTANHCTYQEQQTSFPLQVVAPKCSSYCSTN